jgi:Uncharacterized protein conserved in bacteria
MNGSEPRRVRIELHSLQPEGASVAEYRGILYPKKNSYYIRYEESDADRGRCLVTFKWEENGLTLLRHGEVKAEQSFRLGQRTAGWYSSPAGRLRLEMETLKLAAEYAEEGGLPLSIEWQYELWVNDEKTDRFDLRLMLWEDKET